MLLRSSDAASVLRVLRVEDENRSAMGIHRAAPLARVSMELVSEF